MPMKIQNIRKPQKSQELEVDKEAVRILRTVMDKEAFFFYEAIGKPTGEIARSLSDFGEKIKSVKLESLLFHLQREDFQNWIWKTLGDLRLARDIGRVVPSKSEGTRTKVCSVVEKRVRELGKVSAALFASGDLVVRSASSVL